MGGMGELRLSQPRPTKKGVNKKMDYKTKLAVLGALRYRFENENCKVNLPKETYAKALENF